MKKHRQSDKPRVLKLNKETLVLLTDDQLKLVAGGTTWPSKSPTLCN